jgi:hypothetical protein
MHEYANHNSAHRAARQMQRWTLFQTYVADQAALRKEVCWQLHATTKTSADHGGLHATEEALDAFRAVDLP